jgi:hypothetical protein
VADEAAALVLQKVKVNGRGAVLSVYADRIMIVNADGTRRIPITDVARIAHKAGIRTGRITLTLGDGEQLDVRGLRARDTPTAYRIMVRMASDAK